MARAKTRAGTTHEHDRQSLCPHDGSTLDAHGFCWRAGGYPSLRWYWEPTGNRGRGGWETAATRCPFACPACGGRLDWDGGCTSCVGTGRTPPRDEDRDAWRYPGEYYALRGGHWKALTGPEPALTHERVCRMMEELRTGGIGESP